MEDNQNDEAPPKLLQHKLCGADIFYYFGSAEDAQKIKNWNDITALDGSYLTPKDIIECSHCGERIKTDELEVVMHSKPNPTHLISGDFTNIEHRIVSNYDIVNDSTVYNIMSGAHNESAMLYFQKRLEEKMQRIIEEQTKNALLGKPDLNDIARLRKNSPGQG